MPGFPPLNPNLLSLHLQAEGPLSAESLAQSLNVGRLTVQRGLRQLGSQVVKLGVTRRTRYALRRQLMGGGSDFRIYRLNLSGNQAHEWAIFTALHGGWRLEWAAAGVTPEWASRVHDHAGFCEGLPFFLTDLRPQGYLGRVAARQLPSGMGWSMDPRDWSDDQTLSYLVQYGDDLPGNLAIGDHAVRRAIMGTYAQTVQYAERVKSYPEIAAKADAGVSAGSSVEGEQPKFTAWVHEHNMRGQEAVIVKFTDRLDTPGGRRWADLLVAEQTALNLLKSSSIADAESPSTEIQDFGGRRFYQISRFDRVGSSGRRGVVSLRALHDAGFTKLDTNDWVVAARGLYADGWLSAGDLDVVRLRHTFGQLIGNTDMHFGNLAFFLDNGLPFRLTPAYDMLPMLWAPRPGSAEPAPTFSPVPPLPGDRATWSQAATLAIDFWQRVMQSTQVSDSFRLHAENALAAVRSLHARFG